MERSDIFRKILDAEQKAKKQREEAVRRQEGLDKYLAEKNASARKESFLKADEEIAEAEGKYKATVEEALEKLRNKQERDLLNIHSSFDNKLDEWVDTLFETVVRNS